MYSRNRIDGEWLNPEGRTFNVFNPSKTSEKVETVYYSKPLHIKSAEIPNCIL